MFPAGLIPITKPLTDLAPFAASKGRPVVAPVTKTQSFLAISLYDPRDRIGALAHAMLPYSDCEDRQDAKHIDAAIDKIIEKMEAKGCKRNDLQAKLAGGANLFPLCEDIGKKNVQSARAELKKKGIDIVGECVGGTQGRSVEFAVNTGIITVRIKF